jgi:CHAT domain-containing protein
LRFQLKSPATVRGRVVLRRVIICAMVAFCLVCAAVEFYFANGTFSQMDGGIYLTAWATLSTFVGPCILIYLLLADYRPRKRTKYVIALWFASGAGTLAFGFLHVRYDLDVPTAIGLAAVVASGAGWFVFRKTGRDVRDSLMVISKALPDQSDADEMLRDAERVLASPRLKPSQRKAARINRARALIATSVAAESPDGLVTAADDLQAVLADPPDDPLLVFRAAEELVSAMSVKDDKHDDPTGYQEALHLLDVAADRMPYGSGAMATAYYRRAEYEIALAGEEEDQQKAAALAEAGLARIRMAVDAVTPVARTMLPGLYAKWGVYESRWGKPDRLDEGVALCRRGLELAGRSARGRALPKLMLAIALTRRGWGRDADDEGALPAADTDLREAEVLCRSVIRHGSRDLRVDGIEQLAQVMARQECLFDRPDRATVAAAWRDAAAEAARFSVPSMVRVALDWVEWAESTEEARWCAEAFQQLFAMVPRAAAARYLGAKKARFLGHLQHAAGEAGYWLSEAGQMEDAVVALELGRAVAISETIERERPDIPAALAAAGRPDLLARYQRATAALRAAGDTGRLPGDRFSTAAQRAWAEYDKVVRELSTVAGVGHLTAPVSYQDIAAVARDGPLVFLAAGEQTGYAVVVSGSGRPQWLPLADLTHGRVREQVEALPRRTGRQGIAAILRWLWDNGISELSTRLPAGQLVTLIPVGLLGLLPVHGAGGPALLGQHPSQWTYLTDGRVVRYAPNARALAQAYQRAADLARRPLSLVAADASRADPLRPLQHTRQEVSEIARRWQAYGAPATVVGDATRDDLLRGLPRHSVWHLACHCESRPDEILESGLIVEGGLLSLADIVRLPYSTRRLATMSACESHRSGSELPDEVMGLPGGLLQIGLAGVVASHWKVDDSSTVFLTVRFYDLWRRHGLAPPRALAAAQLWIRNATRADLDSYLPGILPQPRDRSEHGLARWAGVRPFDHPRHWAAFAHTGV